MPTRSSSSGPIRATRRRSCWCSRPARTTPTTTGAGRRCTRAARASRPSARWRRASWSSRSRTAARCSPSPTARACGSSGGPSRSACRCGAAAPAGGTGSGRSSTGPPRTGTGWTSRSRPDLEAASRGARWPPAVRVRRARRVLVVGHARRARRAHRGRRQRRDPQREHLLLAGPVRGRPSRDDLVQVPRRRGPGRRHPAGAPAERGMVGSADRAAGDLDDRPHVLARRVLALRARRAARLRRLHGAPARPLALRGHRTCATATRSAWPTRSSPTRSTAAS